MINSIKEKVGEAYAFFDCNASKLEIEREIPYIRDMIGTPSQLETSLTEGINPQSFDDSKLRKIAHDSNEKERKYFIKANYRNANNEQTASELAAILNQAYQSPLYSDGERFNGEIVYKEKGHYEKY